MPRRSSKPPTGMVCKQLARERITSYDERVEECVELLEDEYDAENIDDEVWQQIKLHYIGLLTTHRQPECAETFFNSVCCKILHRSYFNNDFIFVRPAISTEYIENDEPAAKPTYRAYYPGKDGLAATLERIVTNFQLEPPFEDLTRDVACVMQAIHDAFGVFDEAPNFQIHVLSSLFYRNKSAYIVGRIINGDLLLPFAVPLRHVEARRARARHGAAQARPVADHLQLLAFVLPGGHGSALRLRGVSRHDHAGQTEGGNLYVGGFAEAGQESVLSRPAAPSVAFERSVHHRARHQGARDAGVHAAVVSVRVQADQGPLPAAEGNHAREDQGKVSARQTARPAGPHGRHARIFERRAAASRGSTKRWCANSKRKCRR